MYIPYTATNPTNKATNSLSMIGEPIPNKGDSCVQACKHSRVNQKDPKSNGRNKAFELFLKSFLLRVCHNDILLLYEDFCLERRCSFSLETVYEKYKSIL
jgi:hypothetical protein